MENQKGESSDVDDQNSPESDKHSGHYRTNTTLGIFFSLCEMVTPFWARKNSRASQNIDDILDRYKKNKPL